MDDLSRIKAAFDPELFRQEGHALVNLLADHLRASLERTNPQVLAWQEPEQARRRWGEPAQFASANELFRSVLEQSIHLHHPRFAGHQINPPAPLAALAGLVGDLLNNGMGVYEMGIAGVAIEDALTSLMARRFGFGEEAGGVLTSGGTLGNLTAMLAARSAKAHPCDQCSEQRFAVIASDQSHYCIERAVQVMGWGAEGLIRIPTDDRYRIRVDLLASEITQSVQRGIQPIAVVGSACSTSTGAYDDLAAIAEVCSEHDLWFHVDGAHGAAAIFSTRHRELLKGTEHADSIVIDFHKMLLTPALATALIFRRASAGYSAFSHQADYLWSNRHEEEWFNLSKRTFECTKSMMALKAYCVLAVHGEELLDDSVTRLFDLAAEFAEVLQNRPGWRIATPPQANIVCFQYVADLIDEAVISRLNAELRRRLVEAGRYYLVQTSLHGSVWLRTTLSNPLTSLDDLVSLLEAVEQMAASLLSEL